MTSGETEAYGTAVEKQDVWFFFRGYVTEEILSGTALALKKRLSCEDVDNRIAKSTFFIFVELAQNILRYSAETKSVDTDSGPEEIRFGEVAVGLREGRIFVSSVNLIESGKVPGLKSKLAAIEALDAEGRKRLYKDTLRAAPPEGSKGAGVGFVEIARRATSGFEYSFAEAGDEFSYFSFGAYL